MTTNIGDDLIKGGSILMPHTKILSTKGNKTNYCNEITYHYFDSLTYFLLILLQCRS